jgi:hypothetical protein
VVVRRSRERARLLIPVVAAAFALLAAAPAQAVTGSVANGTLSITGTDGDDYVRVFKGNAAGTLWGVEILGSAPSAGDNCTAESIYLYCTSAGVTHISATTGGGKDQLKITGGSSGVNPDLVTATMGDGNDTYQDDRVNGAVGVNLGDGDDRGQMGSPSVGTHQSGKVDFDGGPGDDNLDGGLDDDVLLGGPGADIIQGWAGDDRINGGADDDLIESDQGNDEVNGDLGDDVIGGGADDDDIVAGPGLDLVASDHDINASGSSLVLSPQSPAGDDRIDLQDGDADEVYCGGGVDQVLADEDDYVTSQAEYDACDFDDDPGDGGGGDNGGGGAVKTGLYDCYSFDLALGNSRYWGSVQLQAGGSYSQAAGRRGVSLVNPRSGKYSASGSRITFSSGPWVDLYGVPNAATKFDVWAKGEQVKSYTCYFKQ